MVTASAIFTGLSWKIPVSKRLYHVITTLVTIIAALSYFAMATGGGKRMSCTRVTDSHDEVPDTHHVVCREIYWARYVDWVLTTPLLLVDLALLAGIDGAHTFMAVAANVVMVLSGLFAAYARAHTAKWGWFAIGTVAYLVVLWHIGLHGFRLVKTKGAKAKRLFTSLAIYTFVLWTLYPIVWGVGDGAKHLTVNTEIITYAVLDVLAKGVFGLWLLWSHRLVPETNVEVGGYWSHGLASEGGIRLADDDA